MKKFLTIALALVMVFAIAAPAFAIGGSPITAAVSSDFDDQYDVDIVFYQGKITEANIKTAVPKADMAAKNQEITAAVVITRKLAPAAAVAIKNYDLIMTYSGFNKDFALAKNAFTYTAATETWTGVTLALTETDVKGVHTDTCANSVIDAALRAAAVAAVGDKLVLTTYGTAASDIKFEAFFGIKLVPTTAVASIDEKYEVSSTATATTKNIDTNVFTVKDATQDRQIVFTTKANGMLEKIEVGPDGSEKEVTMGNYIDATTGKYVTGWITAAAVAAAGTPVTAAEAKLLDAVFADFHFDYAKKNDTALAHSDFLPYLDVPSTTKTATLKLFTAALTVSDTTTVPNTGDNAAVIGFVMIALAIVAAAAVAVKKVRA